MKKVLFLIYTVFGLMVFGLTTSTLVNAPEKSVIRVSQFGKNHFTKTGLTTFYGISEHSEIVLKTVQENVCQKPNQNFKDPTASLITHTRLVVLPFLQYSHHLKNFPISFGKTAIIFPYHYFW